VPCASCGSELIAGKPFCPACGARVEVTCPRCGAAVGPGFRFCPDCGTEIGKPALASSAGGRGDAAPATAADKMDRRPAPPGDARLERLARHIPVSLAEKIRATTGAIEGERKRVTVLFCDLVGSTAIAERLDPEDYHDLLEEYLELAFRQVYRFEGIVNQLAGDGLMALFGAPVSHEDAPRRAVHAALAIRDAIAELDRESERARGLTLQVRIGVHTGPVVVGTVGNDLKMDYTAIGDTTNLAARLESLAGPGQVLVSEATYRLVRGFFELRRAGRFDVKGKTEPVVAYEAVSASAAATPIERAAARGLTPLVGRGEELAQLLACFARLAGRLPQMVAVVGEAGIGKSRLIYEFKQELAAEEVVFFEARSSSLGQVQPYASFVAMLRQYFDLLPDEPPAAIIEKVTRKTDPGLESIFPFLYRMLSVPVAGASDLSPEDLKRETFQGMGKLLSSVSQRTPLVMILEDLQWMDDLSRELIEAAARRVARMRMMMLVSHRPDHVPTWRSPAVLTQLQLRPLTDQESRRVIAAVAQGALPAELEDRIVGRAEGNPFVLEEMTRALEEEGFLVRGRGRIELTRPVEQIGIPDTVQELMGARLDRLRPHAKRVAQVASVLGRQFHRDLLGALLEGEGIAIGPELEELERRGVIHRKSVLSPDEFRFGESLTQEVAYENLLLKQRRQLHDRVARLLEATPGDMTPERAALLAHHFARGESREKALPALLRAAHDAVELPSYRAALSFYRQAWELAEAGLSDQRDGAQGAFAAWALQAALGLCRVTVQYYSPADPGDVERAARRGRELAHALGDAEAEAALFSFHGLIAIAVARERFPEGLALVEQGLAVARAHAREFAAVSISRGLAWGQLVDGRFEEALGTLEWVIAELERFGQAENSTDLYLGCLFLRDRVCFHRDDLSRALGGSRETYERALRADNRTVQSAAAATIAQVHFVRGEHAEAKRWADVSLEIARVIGSGTSLRLAAAVALGSRLELGEPLALGPYLELLEEAVLAGSDMALNIDRVVDALVGAGELKRAERAATVALERAGGRLREVLGAVALGDVHVRAGPSEWREAERSYARAIELARAIGSRSSLAAALVGSADLAMRQGNEAQAAERLRQALAITRELGLATLEHRAERLLLGLEAGTEARQ